MRLLQLAFDGPLRLHVVSLQVLRARGDLLMSKSTLDRRRFTLGAAAAAAATLIRPGESLALPSAPQQPAPATTLEQQAQAALAKLSPAAQAEVEMKAASLFRKYGARLNDEQKTDIRRILSETQDGLEKMRAFVLENSDQPATVFRPYRKEGRS
jgi:hypothetical protein